MCCKIESKQCNTVPSSMRLCHLEHTVNIFPQCPQCPLHLPILGSNKDHAFLLVAWSLYSPLLWGTQTFVCVRSVSEQFVQNSFLQHLTRQSECVAHNLALLTNWQAMIKISAASKLLVDYGARTGLRKVSDVR